MVKCDACEARAKIYVFKKPASKRGAKTLILCFCRHHANFYQPKLLKEGWTFKELD